MTMLYIYLDTARELYSTEIDPPEGACGSNWTPEEHSDLAAAQVDAVKYETTMGDRGWERSQWNAPTF